MRDLLVIFTWIALIPVAFYRAYVGVLLWIWTALIAPNAYVFGFAQSISYNKFITGITAVATVLSREKKTIHWDPTLIVLVIFLFHGTLSYLLSGHNTAAFDIFDKFWKECVLCLFINMLIVDRLKLHSLLVISAIGLGFHGVIEGLKVIASGGAHHIIGLPTLGDNNQFALAILMILPVINYLSRQSANRLVRWGFMIALVLNCLAVVGTWSRGGFIGLAVLALGSVTMAKHRIRSLIVVGGVVLAISAIASASYFSRISSIEEADTDDSFMGRVLAWEVSFAIARDHPIFGAGFHGVQDPGIFGTYVQKVTIPEIFAHMQLPAAKAAHSIYFEVMGDTGFVGLGLFVSLMVLGFANISRILRFTRHKPDLVWIRDLALTFRLMLIVYGITGAGVSMAYFEFVYVLLTAIAVLKRFCDQLRSETYDIGLDDVDIRPPAKLVVPPMAARQVS